MNIHISKTLAILLIASAAFAAGKLTERELNARFYYDLGPDQIDVSAYPADHQERYTLFADKCAQCHTLARPINSPLAKREDWRRYVNRMHIKAAASSKKEISADDRSKIVDFLVYDSKIRKIDSKADFAQQVTALKARFEKMKTERAAQQADEDKRKIKQPANENVLPSPRP